jgi:bifunctional non-homologous end joining protein LigD
MELEYYRLQLFLSRIFRDKEFWMQSNHRFVIHEHSASRHHYDLRLEIGGFLKSWAIPKGPSLDPREKRLAVMVPDHDLSYIDFEGIIPEGSYGAGPVVVWDKGIFIPVDTDDPVQAIEAGRLAFELKGEKLKGKFALALMKGLPKGTGKEWLLMKKKDSFAREGFHIESDLTPARLKTLKERIPPCDTD